MLVVGMVLFLGGYTLTYYGVGMISMYIGGNNARPTAIPLSKLLGFRVDWHQPGGAGGRPYSRPPFPIDTQGDYANPNQVLPAKGTTGVAPTKGVQL